MKMVRLAALFLSLLVLNSLVWPVSVASAGPAHQRRNVVHGTVLSGDTPVAWSTVTLYGSDDGMGRRALGRTRTDHRGAFRLWYKAPRGVRSVVYLTSEGGRLSSINRKVPEPFVLAVVIGPPPYADTVTLNERTTVASAFAMAQFIRGAGVYGPYPGFQIASKMVRHLVDIETGGLGATITDDANGPPSLTLNTFNEMANLVNSCATDARTCRSMMRLARPLRGPAPKDTFRAVANMAKTPWRDPEPLFNLVQSDVFQPDLGSTPPSAWTLALKFRGDPQPFAGPGNIAVDRKGQLWVANNYVHEEGFILPDCASDMLFEMDPTTGLVNTYTGGGVDGVGFGISIAPNKDIWLGNFGFKGTTCPRNPASDSVSQFTSDGVPLSPNARIIPPDHLDGGGWTNGGIGWPQGTVTNRKGDIWIASCNGEVIDGRQVDVTVYRHGNPDNWFVISEPDLAKPFDVAFDRRGLAWVTGTASDNVFAFRANGSKIGPGPFDLGLGSKPMGIASDSRGNVWVSLSGRVDLPCPSADPPKFGRPGVAMLDRHGVRVNTREHSGPHGLNVPGGLTIPWGIAVDGVDNVWVANFEKGGLSSFCGARPVAACPRGYKTGDALSPDATGYASALLDRNTGVAVDSSGNVWLANNWKDIPIQTDPAGDGLVVFIGLAAPVKTPLIGTPRPPWRFRH